MSRVRFHGIKALSKLNNVNLVYSGIGWDNYNKYKSIQENINIIEKTKNIKFNWALVYKPLEMISCKDVKIPVCIRYNEMWDTGWTLKEIAEKFAYMEKMHNFIDSKLANEIQITEH